MIINIQLLNKYAVSFRTASCWTLIFFNTCLLLAMMTSQCSGSQLGLKLIVFSIPNYEDQSMKAAIFVLSVFLLFRKNIYCTNEVTYE